MCAEANIALYGELLCEKGLLGSGARGREELNQCVHIVSAFLSAICEVQLTIQMHCFCK